MYFCLLFLLFHLLTGYDFSTRLSQTKCDSNYLNIVFCFCYFMKYLANYVSYGGTEDFSGYVGGTQLEKVENLWNRGLSQIGKCFI